jgi:hypothetical protein
MRRVGNERSVTNLRSSGPLQVLSPIRASSSMLVGHPSRVRVKSSRGSKPKYRRVLVERPLASYGAGVSIEGKLSDPAGNPRANSAVDVNRPGFDGGFGY